MFQCIIVYGFDLFFGIAVLAEFEDDIIVQSGLPFQPPAGFFDAAVRHFIEESIVSGIVFWSAWIKIICSPVTAPVHIVYGRVYWQFTEAA